MALHTPETAIPECRSPSQRKAALATESKALAAPLVQNRQDADLVATFGPVLDEVVGPNMVSTLCTKHRLKSWTGSLALRPAPRTLKMLELPQAMNAL